MYKIYLYSIIFCFLVSLSSCIMLPNSMKGFYTYKLPISDRGNELFLRMNGIYVPKSDKGPTFFFYMNGMNKWSVIMNDFSLNLDENLDRIEDYNSFTLKDRWGSYSISGDTITIQAFNRNNQAFFKRQVIEYKGIIQSDTSFLLISGYHYIDKYQFLEKPIAYFFFPTTLKPDSSRAWFINKNWYLNDLHESRKPKSDM